MLGRHGTVTARDGRGGGGSSEDEEEDEEDGDGRSPLLRQDSGFTTIEVGWAQFIIY